MSFTIKNTTNKNFSSIRNTNSIEASNNFIEKYKILSNDETIEGVNVEYNIKKTIIFLTKFVSGVNNSIYLYLPSVLTLGNNKKYIVKHINNGLSSSKNIKIISFENELIEGKQMI